MESGWNLRVWLECLGVVRGCCKEAHCIIDILIIIITFPYSTSISSFFGSSISTSLIILNVFSFLFMLFLCNIANVAQRTFEIVQKSNVRRARVPRLPRARHRVTFQESCS